MPATQTAPAPANRSQARTADSHAASGGRDQGPKHEPAILFQKYFKSSGSRTYAAQIKETSKGDHFLVITEGKRDPKTDELRKNWLMIFSEDFPEFFRMLHETAQFIKANPVPDEVRRRRQAYLAKAQSKQENGHQSGDGD